MAMPVHYNLDFTSGAATDIFVLHRLQNAFMEEPIILLRVPVCLQVPQAHVQQRARPRVHIRLGVGFLTVTMTW